MTKHEAIKHFGSSAKLARALGITRAAVTNWGESIPEGRQWELEVLTDGALKADRKEGKAAALTPHGAPPPGAGFFAPPAEE